MPTEKQSIQTLTGELFQPIRLYYRLHNRSAVQVVFNKLHCMEFDKPDKRWVWVYDDEAKKLQFNKPWRGSKSAISRLHLAHHRWVNAALRRQLRRRQLATQRLKRHLRLEIRHTASVCSSSRSVLLRSEPSLSHCPNLWYHLTVSGDYLRAGKPHHKMLRNVGTTLPRTGRGLGTTLFAGRCR